MKIYAPRLCGCSRGFLLYKKVFAIISFLWYKRINFYIKWKIIGLEKMRAHHAYKN